MTPLRPIEPVNELVIDLFSRHPGEGRDPCLMPLAGGAVDPGLRRGGLILLKILN
jgi:hypothetical protein